MTYSWRQNNFLHSTRMTNIHGLERAIAYFNPSSGQAFHPFNLTSGTGPELNTPGTGTGQAIMPPSIMDVEPCKDYAYSGTDKKLYRFTGSAPFTIKVKSHSITGNGIHIGRFTCQYGGPPEKCHIYTIQNTAAASFSLKKQEGRVFGIHGHGSLTFTIDDGTCSNCANSGFTQVGAAPKQRYVKLFTTTKSWDDATEACKDLGTSYRLTMADSQAILDDIKTNILTSVTTSAWIGLRHIAHDIIRATFQWSDGSEFQIIQADGSVVPAGTFVQWQNNNNGQWDVGYTTLQGTQCFRLWFNAHSQFIFGYDERRCTDKWPYICECFE